MSTVMASGLTKHIGGLTLFRDLSFRLEAKERMSLSGRNGAGKTTLLRILASESGIDGGSLTFGKGVRVALHDQRPPREQAISLRDYVLSGLAWVLEIERELEQLEAKMTESADEAVLAAYADAQARLDLAGGYRWRDEATATVRGLGFGEDEFDRELKSFSGGELTRASLARVLAAKPQLMLLDEPTNHLDIESLEWLERYLGELDAAVVLVAHDRWFLESVGTCVLELESERGRFFRGPWHAWRAEKAARELAAGRDVEKRQLEIARMERFVERFRAKASKARQAQSKQKKVDKLKAVGTAQHNPARNRKDLSFSFAPAARSGRVVLEMKDATVKIGERTLLEDSELWLERGEHVCLVGPNGSGKSTLISALTGDRELDAGSLRHGHNVSLGYLSQHTDIAGGEGTTVLSHAQRETGLPEAKVRGLLGRFLFSGDEVTKLLRDISGGEARRLSLALLVSSDSNLLVLDEPTNHLDVESREALEDALARFDGTMLLISHDRALLEAVGSRTVSLQERHLRSHPGGWAEYREMVEAARLEAAAQSNAGNGKGAKPKDKAKGPSKNAKAKSERLGREVEQAEQELKALEAELADPSKWSNTRESGRSTSRHEAAKAKLEKLETEWEEALEHA
ncbi:ABC-F family ATP-binding cassette domain-containing protein [soil metagenome]